MLLILKIFLVPIIILLISYAGRVLGPAISGWLGGLPIIAGPILLFLNFDQGAVFASSAAMGALAGVSSLVTFCFVYAHISKIFGVALSLSVSVFIFLLTTSIFMFWEPGASSLFLLAIILIFSASKLLPSVSNGKIAYAVPNREIAFRMFAAAVLVLAITGASSILGPRLSGLLAPFPIAGTILAGFSHYYYGHEAAVILIRGFLRGLLGMAIFDYVLVILGPSQGFGLSFAIGILGALVVGGIMTSGVWRKAKASS